MLFTWDPLWTEGQTLTESEGLNKGIPCKQKFKNRWSSNTRIRWNRLLKKTITRDKEEHYIMIKGSIQEEDIAIIITYAPKTGAPQYIRQMLTTIKGEIDNNKIIVGDFNIPFIPMDR